MMFSRLSLRSRAGRSVPIGAVACGLAVALAVGGCVSAPPRSSPGTTQLAPASFCDPIRALSSDAWVEGPDRTAVMRDLSAALSHAPAGMHDSLEALIRLEQSGVHPVSTSGVDGTEASGLDQWFGAMSALAEVAARECDIDLVAAALASADLPPGSSVPPPISGAGTGTGARSFEDIVALVRSSNPAASWVDDGLRGIVGEGGDESATQIVVFDVGDADIGRAVCQDVATVLNEPAATVIIRNRAGLVIVERIDGTCETLPTP